MSTATLTADIDRKIPLAEAIFPGDPHVATRWRWKSKGVTRNGVVIRLRTIVCGGRVFTTQRWADEFCAACNADQESATVPATDPTRQARAEQAALMQALG